MMIIDNNGFLSLASETSNPKLYTHTVGGQICSEVDHIVLVWHKGEIKSINWKDLGKTMNLIKKDRSYGITIRPTTKNMLTLFSGFDEQTGNSYYFFPKLHGEKLENIENILNITIIDKIKGWFTINESSEEEDNLLYKLFVLSLLGGKTLIKGQNFLSLKIQIPIPTPFFACKGNIESLIQDLQLLGYSIAGFFVSQINGGMFEINTNDYDILFYLKEHNKSLASIKKIVTKELSDEVKVILISQYPESKELIGERGIKLFEVR